jgi:hypothetical protein
LKHTNSEKLWAWHTTFIGQYMQHNYWLYHMLDNIIENNLQIKSIVEIGTGHGALTTVLGLYGIKKNIPVFTVDIYPKLSQSVWSIFKALNVQHCDGNVFSNAVVSKMDSIINGKPTYIICDGGNKPKEFNFWVPKMPIDSIISAHDWEVEISTNDIKDTVDKHLIQYMPERWNEMNVQFATFKKVK